MRPPKAPKISTSPIFPIEFDSLYVYIGGKREKITSKEYKDIVPIHRYPNRKSIIGRQVKSGYVFFKHIGRNYKGYFEVMDNGKYGIIKLTVVRKKR